MGKPSNRGRPGWRLYLGKILSIWKEKDETLTFSKIHKEFVKLGIVSDRRYKASTHRILKQLVKEGYLEKTTDGYKLKISPKPFNIIETINEVRKKYGDEMIYEWRAGGTLWTLAEGIIFGMPREVEKSTVYEFILSILLIRLAKIFEAIKVLAIAVKLARKEGKNIEVCIPETVMREFILNIVPYVLGELSGIDGDGLPTEDLIEVYKMLTSTLPQEIHDQPIMKDIINEYLDIGAKLYKNSINVKGLIGKTIIVGGKEVESKINELEKVILVVYPPGWIVDKNYEERELYELLRYSIEEGDSDALLLAHLRVYDEDVVYRVLRYLEPLLNAKRATSLKRLYRLARAGMVLDSVVARYLDFKELKDEPERILVKDELLGEGILVNPFAGKNEEEILKELKRYIKEARKKYGYTIEDMVKGIWLSNWSLNITPSFTRLRCTGSKDIVSFVEDAVRETLEAIGVKVPSNLSLLVREGYSLVRKLDEQLKSDAKKVVHRLKKYE